jgi:GWxTD domain-containing protein
MFKTFLLLALAALSFTSALAQKQERKLQSNPTVQSDLRPVYQKWLDEDVVYIITAEESRAFLLLKSDGERERFIEQFWRARDSKPGTSENEYRAEHYRRIANANQRFGTDNVPGWRTVRGRFYITLGEPDEIHQTSAGEVWFYRHAGSLGDNVEIEFTRDSKSGGFRIRQHP